MSADYDPDTVLRMLSFLYKGDYDDEIDSEVREQELGRLYIRIATMLLMNSR